MPTNILIICSTKFFADSVLKNEINYFINAGYKIDLVCTVDGFDNNKVNCRVIDVQLDRHIRPLSNIRSLIEIIRIIRLGKYEVVHTHNHVVGILGRTAAKLAGVKIIFHTAHGFFFHDRMNKVKYFFYFLFLSLLHFFFAQ